MSEWVVVELSDDWEGLFVDGKLVDQDHSTHYRYWLSKGPLPTSFRREQLPADYPYCELPKEYADLQGWLKP